MAKKMAFLAQIGRFEGSIRFKTRLFYRLKDDIITFKAYSRQLLIVFLLGFGRIFPKLFFEGSLLFHLSKLLFFEYNPLGGVLFLTDFHLIIDLLHKNDFWLSLFGILLGSCVFNGLFWFSSDVDSSPSLLVHRIIVYMQLVIFQQSTSNITYSVF